MTSNRMVFIVALIALCSQSVCTTEFCIASNSVRKLNQSCMALNEFAKSDYYMYSEITLILRPGIHTLNMSILVFNSSEFTILSEDRENTRIVFESQVNFIIENAGLVNITGTHFIGCGTVAFNAVGMIFIKASVFTENCFVLVFNETTTLMSNSFFYHNKLTSTQSEQVAGAATLIMSSNMTIHDCVFESNSKNDGIINAKQSLVKISRCHFSENSGNLITNTKGIIMINDSSFFQNSHINRSRLITVLFSLAVIENTNFTENSEVIFGALSTIEIKQCNFTSNYVPENTGYLNLSPERSYGGIILSFTSIVSFTTCSFVSNRATEYGAIVVMNNVTFVSNKQLQLVHNIALEGVFVLINSRGLFGGNTEFTNNTGSLSVLVAFCEFTGNILFSNNTPSRDQAVLRGGAISLYFSTLSYRNASAILSSNSALSGGAILAIGSNIYADSVLVLTNNVAEISGGALFLYQSQVYIHSNVSVDSNVADTGGGIYVLSSYIAVRSSVNSTFHYLTLTNNKARMGGGLYFSSAASLYIYHIDQRPHRLTTILTSNVADEYGGSIYFGDEVNVVECEANSLAGQPTSAECFFQVVDLYRQAGTVGLYFESNTANKSGSVLFGGLLDRCIVSPIVSLTFFDSDIDEGFSPQNGLSYLKLVSNLDSTDSIASYPVSVCFCFNGTPNCNESSIRITSQRGSNVTITVIALDQVGHPMNATIFAELPSSTGGLGDGQQSQAITDRCTDLSLSVTSKESSEEVIIFAEGPCVDAQPSIKRINLTFSECRCPIGFDEDNRLPSNCQCICSESIRNYTQDCTIETQSFLKSRNAWIGYDNTTDSAGIIISRICPYDYCVQFDSIDINLNVPNGADVQCTNNRAGILCGGCLPSYSISIGQSGCIQCGDLWPLFTMLILIAIVVIGVIVVIAILFLHLSVTVGTINGFIFSANILKAVYPFSGQYYGTYIISFLNLDLGLNVCFYDGFDTYAKTWLELVIPGYLIFIVALISLASNYSSKFSTFLGKRNPVDTLATLIFLSYSKILQFTVTGLALTTIRYVNSSKVELVWLSDGSIKYFGIKHTFMVIAAIVIIIIVLIYTFLLLFWQAIVKLPNWKIFALFRNTKLQGFIEMYHVPFHVHHRYWTGLLLLIRIIVYLVAVGTSTTETRGALHLTITVSLSLLLLIKSLYARVYKKWPVDVLESVLITLTIIVTGYDWYALQTSKTKTTLAVTASASIIIVCLLAAVIVYHLKKYVIKKKAHIPKRLTKLSQNLRQRSLFKSRHHNEEENSEELDVYFPNTANLQYLNVDRFDSIIRVMDTPTESDYQALHIQYLRDRDNTENSQDENESEIKPTFSSI